PVVSSKELRFSISTVMSTTDGVTPSLTADAAPARVSSFIVSLDFVDTPIPEVCKAVVGGGMEHRFLSQKESEGGRGIKEKSLNRISLNTSLGIGVSTKSKDTINEDTLASAASTVKDGVTPSVVDMTVEMENLSSLEDTTGLGSFPKLSMPVNTTACNTPDLKDNIVMAMPTITREGHYICNVYVEYEWKPPRCASCKVFGHIHKDSLKNIGAIEKKTVKKPSQTSRSVLEKGVEPTIEVSYSNPFEVLNLVDNDEELGTNEGNTNLVNNGATLSGSSFINVDNSSTASNPLKKIEFLGDYDSEDEVASVDNDMARSMASKRVDFGTQSFLE
nr:hypothetical protein [Tanacetum cinerariifolium]